MFDLFNDIFTDFDKAMKNMQKKFEDAINSDTPGIFAKNLNNYKCEKGEDDTSTWKHETWTDESGMFQFSRKVMTSKVGQKVTREEEIKKPTVDELKKKMSDYAANHQYEKAAEIRDMIKKMEEK